MSGSWLTWIIFLTLVLLLLYVTGRSLSEAVIVVLITLIVIISLIQQKEQNGFAFALSKEREREREWGFDSSHRENFDGSLGTMGTIGTQGNTENNGNLEKVMNSISGPSGNASTNFGKYGSGLVLFYNSFSSKSYPRNTRKWLNIAPYFPTDLEVQPTQACPGQVLLKDTHLYFTETPGYSKSGGFLLGKNKVVGPRSHELGINANDSFTFAMLLKFDGFTYSSGSGGAVLQETSRGREVESAANSVELLKLFANTPGNNGLDFGYGYAAPVTGGQNMTQITMYIHYGQKQFNSATVTVNTGFVYLITIIKTMGSIQVNLYPNVGDIASTPQLFNTLLSLTIGDIEDDTDVLLANKEMQVNGTSNAQVHLFAIAVWNRSLPDFVVADFYNAFQAELQKSNETLRNLAGQISNLQREMMASKQCPFDESTCSLCSGVRDWRNTTDLLQNGGDACLRKINAFCSANPTAVPSFCSCWNPANALSKTTSCQSYRAMFTGNPLVINDIDTDTLSLIKSQFDLCACNTCNQGSLSSSSDQKEDLPVLVPPIPHAQKSDLDYYNDIRVGGSGSVAHKLGLSWWDTFW